MKPSHPVQLVLRLLTLGAILYLAGFFGARWLRQRANRAGMDGESSQARQSFLRTYGSSELRILQFYAREAQVVEGHSTVLCYGVLNAKAVRVEPPVEGVSPALNRCVEVAPVHDIRYTLTAEGEDGRAVSEALNLTVVPDPATLPRITSFGIANKGVDRGRPYFKLEFRVENAETVAVDPPVIPTLHGAPLGQFVVSPAKNTVYTLTVTGKYGHKVARKVEVKLDPAQL